MGTSTVPVQHIFLSYTRPNLAFTRRLREQLHTWGYPTWMDIHDIPKATYWPDEIDKGLRASNAIIGVLSPQGLASRNVKNEWDWAIANDRPLILLRIEDCNLPAHYISINYIDFVGTDETAAFQHLAASLEALELSRSDVAPDESPNVPPEPLPEQVSYREISRTPHHVSHVDETELHVDQNEQTNRSRMLKKVRDFWISGVLDHALVDGERIKLLMDEKRDAVTSPVQRVLQHPTYSNYRLEDDTSLLQVFEDVGRDLLILGDPGSGKTTTMLELARALLDKAESNTMHPIPVILTLSSWAERAWPIANWVVERLNTEYQVPRQVGRAWLENGDLLLLLDGLDEVRQDRRDDCVTMINTFRRDYDFIDIVVCSRIKDYEQLTTQFTLQGAVVLEPLKLSQADAYLLRLGEGMGALREVMTSDPILQEFAKSPFMLNIMAVAYRGKTVRELSGFTTAEARRDDLFRNYVEYRFNRQRDLGTYTLKQIRDYLNWLADAMHAHSQSVFYIESMQPDWLQKIEDRRRYRLLASGLFGLLMGAGYGLTSGVAHGVLNDPLSGLLWGLLVFVGSGLLTGLGMLMTSGMRFSSWRAVIFGLSFALAWALSVGGTTLLNFGAEWGIPFGLIVSVGAGFACGVAFGLPIGLASDRDRIKIIERLSWSPKRGLLGMIGGMLLGIVLGIIANVFFNLGFGIEFFLALGLPFALDYAILIGLVPGRVSARSMPNEGVRRSLRNSLRLSTAFFVITGIATVPAATLANGPAFGVMSGILLSAMGLGGVFIGGITVIQHAALRYLLQTKDQIPVNLTVFLDHVSDIMLMRPVGGGFLFIHRYLMEYFSSLSDAAGRD